MSHRILYIENSKKLNLYLDNLHIESEHGELLFPVSDLQILVIDNYQSVLTIPLINKLTENNVCVIICGYDHLPQSYLLPMNGHFAQSGNIRLQIKWSEDVKAVVHQLIVKAKILNQIEVLKVNNKDFNVIEKLYQYVDEVQPGDVTNREGLAAKMYFRALFGNDFSREDDDVINAGLNYGYAVFRSLISSIIVAKGYLPNIGFFHKGKENMFNLSDDLIEVYRPIVDHFVYNNLSDEMIFKREHRLSLIQLTNHKLLIDDKKQTIANSIYLYFEGILKFIETGNVDNFVFPLPHLYDNDI